MEHYDAIVVGGGHNGLVAAAYLSRAGQRTLVCEAREVVGGAAVTERPFGPDYKVTSLSYVVSLMPQGIVRDLDLHRHGYKVYPQGPYFAPHARGTSLKLSNDPVKRATEIFRHRDWRPEIQCQRKLCSGEKLRRDTNHFVLAIIVNKISVTSSTQCELKRPSDFLSRYSQLSCALAVDGYANLRTVDLEVRILEA